MKKRQALLFFAAGYFAYAIVGWAFPPITLGYWRFACSRDVAFSGVGIAGEPSFQWRMSARINDSLAPAASYRLLYWIGTPAAKCHALVGLRRFADPHFERYLSQLEQNDEIVMLRWMDMGEGVRVSSIASGIRSFEEDLVTVYQKEYAEWVTRRHEKEYGEPHEQKPSSGQRPVD